MNTPVAPPPPPLARRALDTLVAPRRLARSLRVHAPWLGVLVVTTLVAMLVAGTLPAEFYLDQMENPVNRRGRPVTVTSPPEDVVLWGRLLQALSALVGHPVQVLAVAGVVTLLFTVVGGGEVGFRRYLSLTAHAFLIPALGALLVRGWQVVSGDADAQISVAALFGAPGEGGGMLWRVLENLDLFSLWMLVVVALGVGVLDRRRTVPQALALLVALYLALSIGVAALGGVRQVGIPS